MTAGPEEVKVEAAREGGIVHRLLQPASILDWRAAEGGSQTGVGRRRLALSGSRGRARRRATASGGAPAVAPVAEGG